MRPRERYDMVRKHVEEDQARRKEKDHHWEDMVDVSTLSKGAQTSSLTACAESFPTHAIHVLFPPMERYP